MITEFLVQLGVWVFGWTAEQLPQFNEVEGVVVTANTYLGPIADGMASLSAWVPWEVAALCVPLVAGVYLTSLVVKLGRAVLSHVPFFGGAG